VKMRCNVYIILIAVLLFIQQIISGCTAPASKDLYKKDLYKEEVDLISRAFLKINVLCVMNSRMLMPILILRKIGQA